MPRSYKGHKYTLSIINEVTNYLITGPIHESRSEEIGDALLENVIPKYCAPDYMLSKVVGQYMLILYTKMFICYLVPYVPYYSCRDYYIIKFFFFFCMFM